MSKFVKRVHQVAWHRNGVGGEGFHAVVFDHEPYDDCPTCGGSWGWTNNVTKQEMCENQHTAPAPKKNTRRMLGIVYDKPGYVSVLDIDKLTDPTVGVAFGDTSGGNSWRGDRFERELREAIDEHASDGSVRLGPFAIPTKRRKKKTS